MACGSGAFLVQACRYLAERLVEGWEQRRGAVTDGRPLVDPGRRACRRRATAEQLLPHDPEERLALARRLVAERCLYGVDKNPMAVEMAKLSLWLVTLHKDRPFTFLDHAIKCGDSLLGLHDPEQVESFHLRPGRAQARVVDYVLAEVRSLLAPRACTARGAGALHGARRPRRRAEGPAASRSRELAGARTALADLIVGASLRPPGRNATAAASLLDARLDELLLAGRRGPGARRARATAAEPQDEAALLALRRRPLLMLGAQSSGAATPAVSLAGRISGGVPASAQWRLRRDRRQSALRRRSEDHRAARHRLPRLSGAAPRRRPARQRRPVRVLLPACAAGAATGGNFGLLAVNTIAEGDTRQVGLEAMLRGHRALRRVAQLPVARCGSSGGERGARGARSVGQAYALSGADGADDLSVPVGRDEWSPKSLQANIDKCSKAHRAGHGLHDAAG